jgi:hypothetical protein
MGDAKAGRQPSFPVLHAAILSAIILGLWLPGIGGHISSGSGDSVWACGFLGYYAVEIRDRLVVSRGVRLRESICTVVLTAAYTLDFLRWWIGPSKAGRIDDLA